jgi:hypothetical protein
MNHRKKAIALAGTAALALAATGAHASLVLVGQTQMQGTGFGTVNTVLTISSPGSGTVEAGSVGVASNGQTVTSGDVQSGGQGQALFGTPTLGSLGLTSLSDLRIVFNAVEPAGNSITLQTAANNAALALTFFTQTGGTWSSAYTATLNPNTVPFATTQTGTGNSGYVFALDSAHAAAATTAIGAGNLANARIGLGARAIDATGGPETFFVARANQIVSPIATPVIPEPSTWALMLAGLVGLGAVARRRAKQ